MPGRSGREWVTPATVRLFTLLKEASVRDDEDVDWSDLSDEDLDINEIEFNPEDFEPEEAEELIVGINPEDLDWLLAKP